MILGLFLLQFTLVWVKLWLFQPLLGNARWPDGLLVVLTTATVLASLACQLPGQNVMLVSVIIAFLAGAVQTLGALTAIPFGPLVYTEHIGQQLFYPLPWAMPMVWIALVLASRGVTRLMLRPWRRMKNYGFLLIGLTTILVVAFDIALEPFARVKHLWLWQPTKIPVTWHGASPLSFLGWLGVSLLSLAVIMPYLIRKQPGNPSAPDFTPLALWLGAIALFSFSAAQAALWTAVAVNVAVAGVATIFSWRGAKW